MIESRIEFEVESIIEGYDWFISYKNEASEVYVVSINFNDIDFENNKVNYISIENSEYLYYISGGDEKIIELGYDIFKTIEGLVVEEIKKIV
jgi:hypothetical protein